MVPRGEIIEISCGGSSQNAKKLGISCSGRKKKDVFIMIDENEVQVRFVDINADEQNLWCCCSVPAGSIIEEFREFVSSRWIEIEDESAFGVEGEFRCLPGGGGFR